jgi:hypothetical protein
LFKNECKYLDGNFGEASIDANVYKAQAVMFGAFRKHVEAPARLKSLLAELLSMDNLELEYALRRFEKLVEKLSGGKDYVYYLRGLLISHLTEFPNGEEREYLNLLMQCPKGWEKGTVGPGKKSSTGVLWDPILLAVFTGFYLCLIGSNEKP